MSKEPCSSSDVADYSSFSKKIDRELSMRRRRGRVPFDARCTHCMKSRSTLHHGRMSKSSHIPIDHQMFLIQADFFFIDGNKFIILVDAGTGLLGVSLCGTDQDQTMFQPTRHFRSLALESRRADGQRTSHWIHVEKVGSSTSSESCCTTSPRIDWTCREERET